jgi:hypothetical protein
MLRNEATTSKSDVFSFGVVMNEVKLKIALFILKLDSH